MIDKQILECVTPKCKSYNQVGKILNCNHGSVKAS